MSYLEVMYGGKPKTDYPYKLCEYLLDRFKFHSPILDVGPGRFEFAEAFTKLAFQVLTKEQRQGWVRDRVHTVFLKSVIEHCAIGNMPQMSYRALRYGGRIIVLTPDWLSQWQTFYDDPTHVHPYTPKGLENALKIAGFKDVHVELFYQLPILWKYPWLRPFMVWNRWAREAMILGTGVK
jgi:hypothetical protein